mmetsp:Transcript_45176/g.131439  ORF Transcript_45176/g.131439 Transcript_45176/m.131439 type:complete len:231 (+) Transcript_45176:708-1400(+)
MRDSSKSKMAPYRLMKTSPMIHKSEGTTACNRRLPRRPAKLGWAPGNGSALKISWLAFFVLEHMGPWTTCSFPPGGVASVVEFKMVPLAARRTSVSQRVPSPRVSTTTSLITVCFVKFIRPPKSEDRGIPGAFPCISIPLAKPLAISAKGLKGFNGPPPPITGPGPSGRPPGPNGESGNWMAPGWSRYGGPSTPAGLLRSEAMLLACTCGTHSLPGLTSSNRSSLGMGNW